MSAHETHRIPCPDCLGTGNDPESPWLTCTWCLGIGAVHVNTPHAGTAHEFPDEPPGRELPVPEDA